MSRRIPIAGAGWTARHLAVLAVLAMLAVSCTGQRPDTDTATPTATTTAEERGAEDDHGPGQAETVSSTDDDRRGEVHIHEDGSSHTHGAGAPKEWVVVYTAEGKFEPERIDILAGDTVTWKNESDVGVWPASNIHPSHEILPEFDPLEDIPPGESWSFKFDENGYWRYHNHSYASEVGLVVVTGGPEQDILEVMGNFHDLEFSDPPANPDHQLLLTDWDALEDFVLEYGPEATVATLFAYEVETGWQCHAAAHEIGRIAYQAFGASVFSIESHQCSTGVLHGVVEAMLAERGTANLGEDITAVCMATDSHFTQASCWHGVGHGVMAWTSYEIHDALELCDLVEGVGGAWGCYSGVFMENVVGGMADLTGHESEYIDPNDPHLPCSVVAERYIEPCYSYQGIHMVHVFHGDYRAVIGECMSIDEDYQVPCLRAMGSNVGGVHKRQPASAAQACGLIPSSVPYLHCISGAINEMYRHPDEAAYVIDFCDVLEDQDRAGANECWWSLIDRTEALIHTREGREDFCTRLPPGQRQQYCREQVLPEAVGN